jgi:hypothetical protein
MLIILFDVKNDNKMKNKTDIGIATAIYVLLFPNLKFVLSESAPNVGVVKIVIKPKIPTKDK